MFIKENFWVGVKGGLVEEKHYLCMRESVWFYLFLLLKQTALNESGEGVVNYGHPMTRSDIQDATGFHERRIEDWIDRLRRTGYIRTESRNKEGLIFFIQFAKNKTKRPTRKNVPVEAAPTHNNGTVPLERASQPTQEKRVTLVGGSPIPKDLSYLNKDAAIAVKNLSREKRIPTPKSWEQQKAELRQKGLLQ